MLKESFNRPSKSARWLLPISSSEMLSVLSFLEHRLELAKAGELFLLPSKLKNLLTSFSTLRPCMTMSQSAIFCSASDIVKIF